MNSNNLISNAELRALYPTSLNSDADKIEESRVNEVAGRIELRGMLEMSLRANFAGTFFFFSFFYFLFFFLIPHLSIFWDNRYSSGAKNTADIPYVSVQIYVYIYIYIHCTCGEIFLRLEIGGEIYLDGGF